MYYRRNGISNSQCQQRITVISSGTVPCSPDGVKLIMKFASLTLSI